MAIRPLNDSTRSETRRDSALLVKGSFLAALAFAGCSPTSPRSETGAPNLEAELVSATGDTISNDYALSGSVVLPTNTATSANYRLSGGITTLQTE